MSPSSTLNEVLSHESLLVSPSSASMRASLERHWHQMAASNYKQHFPLDTTGTYMVVGDWDILSKFSLTWGQGLGTNSLLAKRSLECIARGPFSSNFAFGKERTGRVAASSVCQCDNSACDDVS